MNALSNAGRGAAPVGRGESPLLCFGDSLTAGYGAGARPDEDDRSRSYPALLQKRVRIPVINAGVSGETSAGALTRVSALAALKPCAAIVEFGANDFFCGVDPAVTKANLHRILAAFGDTGCKLYLVKFYTPFTALDDPAMTPAILRVYDELYAGLAATHRAELIADIWSGVWGIHMSGGIHPNGKGYAIMAETYFNILEPWLRAENVLKE